MVSAYQVAVGLVQLSLALVSCSPLDFATGTTPRSPTSDSPANSFLPDRSSSCSQGKAVLWSNRFAERDWQADWQIRTAKSWGLGNSEVINDPSHKFSKVLRVRYKAGSASPRARRLDDTTSGGTQFFADLGLPPQDSLCLSYYVRFSKRFDFVKGGKLPGVFGGTVNDGRKIPDGTNGFSTRLMWRARGVGEVYAYLPTSQEQGTSIGRGNWQFQPGTWHHLEQQVVLNQPGQQNGQIRVWLDGKPVLSVNGLMFRTRNALKIEGILFSTFFGGGDRSWATPKNVYADFANFSVY
ncbi:MAG: hypothetical protein HC866_24200 [Leptolyngbyaceae cyanobacterium RU_5_1]|nr:hypothetical protein [Leptolyngbyaceae cyanobacterium RU_5_1]